MANTTKVMKNRMRPSSINEDVYISPTASVNSLAKAEEMVLPGIKSEELRSCELPITKVTAMVSPNALPQPSMLPPTTPIRV